MGILAFMDVFAMTNWGSKSEVDNGAFRFCVTRSQLRVALLSGLFCGALFGVWQGFGQGEVVSENQEEKSGAITLSLMAPSYMKQRPIVFLSPSGQKIETGSLQSATEGSRLEVRAENTDKPPVFEVAGREIDFERREDGSYFASFPLDRNHVADTATVELKQGWTRIGTWHVRMKPDQSPQITMIEPPQIMARYATKLAFSATDDHAIDRIAVRARLLGVPQAPWSEYTLTTPKSDHSRQTLFADLTFMPFSGKRAEVQLIAYDAKEQMGQSEIMPLDFPTRVFEQPLARALIEERQRLLLNAKNEAVRNEIANIIAGIGRQTTAYGKDTAVLMALRAGAVRLVLSSDDKQVASVAELLWKIATRIEDGKLGKIQSVMRQSSGDLGHRLERYGLKQDQSSSTQRDILMTVARMQALLTHYIEEYSAARAEQPPAMSDSDFILQTENDFWTREDLYQMLDLVRDKAEKGSYDEAQTVLLRFQNVLENVKFEKPELTTGIRDILARAQALRLLARAQKKLRDQTFLALRDGESKAGAGLRKKLMDQQNMLRQKLIVLREKGQVNKSQAEKVLDYGDDAMRAALKSLQDGAFQTAYQNQSAVADQLQKAATTLIESAHAEMATLSKSKK